MRDLAALPDRGEELERQFEDIFGELQFSEAFLDWMREAAAP
jgi:hypothetical protein